MLAAKNPNIVKNFIIVCFKSYCIIIDSLYIYAIANHVEFPK